MNTTVAQQHAPRKTTPSNVIELRAGRTESSWTQIHDWVMLAEIDAHAKALYTVYRMHINHRRGDDMVWPGTVSLARLIGVCRYDRVAKYNKQLVEIGAIDIIKQGMPARNVYVVHSTPPSGYEGPRDIAEWYATHGDELDSKRKATSAKNGRNRTGGKPKEDPVATKNGQQEKSDKTQHITLPCCPDSVATCCHPEVVGTKKKTNQEETSSSSSAVTSPGAEPSLAAAAGDDLVHGTEEQPSHIVVAESEQTHRGGRSSFEKAVDLFVAAGCPEGKAPDAVRAVERERRCKNVFGVVQRIVADGEAHLWVDRVPSVPQGFVYRNPTGPNAYADFMDDWEPEPLPSPPGGPLVDENPLGVPA